MKKLMSFILVLAMLIGIFPMNAMAANDANLTNTEWKDVSAVFVGDSITYGTGTNKTYHSYIKDADVFQSVQAMGVGGSCISTQSDYGTGNSPLINRYTSIPDADLIVIFMGTNDYGHETPLGTIDDTTDVSFYGALNVIIPGIQEQHPDSQLVFVTPLHRYGFGTSKILGTQFTYDSVANGRGYTLADYVNAVKVVCESYSVPVIDLFEQYPIDPSNSTDRAEYMPDGLHPNATGHELIAELIQQNLEEIFVGVSGECEHSSAFIEGKDATCQEDGYQSYWLCTKCGKSFASNENTVEVKKEDLTIPAAHTYENGVCTGCGDIKESLALRFDDHYDITGKTVEIMDAGIPTSYQVGYGVEENTVLDTAVVTVEGNNLVATGIGTAVVMIDGQILKVNVEAAPISLLLLIGQSNMRGSEGNADQSIVCPDGMVYATFGDDRGDAEGIMNVNNATKFAASALTGAYSTINVEGTTEHLSYYPLNSLTEDGAGTFGPDSGFAYEWVEQTGEKVWIVNAAHGGSSMTSWQPNATNFKEAVLLFNACQETLRKEIAAGHFTLSHMGYFWCQGCSDYNWTAEKYVNQYMAMHNGLKTSMAFDHDSNSETASRIFEFAGIIPVRAGHDYNDGYREDVYAETSSYKFYESFMDLQMTGPRVAQYWLGNNPELEDIWLVCNIGEDWVWMPDGTNGVAEYFQTHYANGTVDYVTQVAQKASWYTPTTPAAVHDSIHYNQIGYNEVGREAARNALIMLGEIDALEVELSVDLVGWDGYTPVEIISASLEGKSETLIVPKVYPVWKSKDISYTLSEGLNWEYYDLLVMDESVGGVLTVEDKTVVVTGHTWSEWETLCEPSAQGPGQQQRTCRHCDGVEKRDVQGVWQIYDLGEHLLELPKDVCGSTNLWTMLPHEDVHFTSGKKWGKTGTATTSITIPVNPGDKIYATSWKKAGENGHETSNGIRVTFFDTYGIAKTMGPGQSDREFYANGGYLVAPEGTIAINIVMWYDSEDYEVYILNRDHIWGEWTELEAPTCDEEGQDQRVCVGCGEKEYRDTRITGDENKILVSSPIDASEFVGKRLLLIGDSITSGVGTTKTYGAYLAESLGVKVTNKGVSGSGYCSGGEMSTNKTLTEANVRNADIVTIMLGVNDWNWAVKDGSWNGKPGYYDTSWTYYQLGNFNSTDTSTLYGALHSWCQKIVDMKQIDGFEDKQFIVITPLITSWNISIGKKNWDQDKLNIHGHVFREYCTAIMEVCAYYDIPVFDANMFSGIYYRSAEDNNIDVAGGDGVHVNAEGHALLAESLKEFLLEGYSYECRSAEKGGHDYDKGVCQDCRLPQQTIIKQQPLDVEMEIGQRFAVTVKAEGAGLTYQWYYKNAGMKNFEKSSNKTSSYAYTMQSYMHNRQVYCVITDARGNQVTTDVATITRPPMEVQILVQPQDAQAAVGERFSISPQVQGDGLTYQWYYKEGSGKSFAVSSNKTSAYAYTMQKYMNNRQVYCVITDKYGNQVTTEVATITLPPVELKILLQPEDAYAPVGQKFSISPQVQGDGLTYQWYYKEGSGKKFAASSNKTAAYAYTMQSYMNNRQVYCVITDKYGNQVTTEVVTIHVNK